MTSRAQRLSGRQGIGPRRRWRAAVAGAGATDEFAGLGRVEQLVLRGDGLTTTSLEILTGQRVTVEVLGHCVVAVPEPGPRSAVLGLATETDGSDAESHLAAARVRLDAAIGDLVLIREVLLVGSGQDVLGCAEVVALSRELPMPVAHALSTTDQPLGRLLNEHDVPVRRELHRWGLLPAGPQAHRLSPALDASSRVPGREYVMRNASTGRTFGLLVERFSPHVFSPAADRLRRAF
jgi:chorismate-pyruvate lyase